MSAGAPAWAALSAGACPALVARAVTLAARRTADPEQVRGVLAARLDTGAPTDAAAVLSDLEAGSGPRAAGRPGADGLNAAPGANGPGGSIGVPAAADDARAAAAALRSVDAKVLIVGEPGYPARLASAWPELGAPLWLFVRTPAGRLPDGPAVAVVGTRRASLDGLRTARELGRLLAANGVTVVSGMARGIDQAAHRGALDAGGPTVAVLGAGLDVDYPRGSGRLRAAVAAAGGLVGEHLPGVAPRPVHFLWRNRIISGLADATVVVEGRERSGALQTARLAAAQGRDVLAVPGSLNSPTSRAPLDLIRDGAQPVTRLDDVLDIVGASPSQRRAGTDLSCADTDLRGAGAEPAGRGPGADPSGAGAGTDPSGPAAPPGLGPPAAAVLDLLGAVPVAPGALAAHTGLGMGAVLAAVGDLTARGLAHVTPRGITRGSR